jgi:hypothetical protein
LKRTVGNQFVRFETFGAFRIRDFNRPKHRMGHQGRKTIVSPFQSNLQNLFVESACAKAVRSGHTGGGPFDVVK